MYTVNCVCSKEMYVYAWGWGWGGEGWTKNYTVTTIILYMASQLGVHS